MYKLFIKNMVCPRCVQAVEQILENRDLSVKHVQLGEAELEKEPSKTVIEQVRADLEKAGFELLDDSRSKQIEQIKTLLIGKVQQADIEDHFGINKFLTAHIFKDYSSLSKLFSEVEGITIEQFFILQKIEKIKELLVYNEKPLNEIAFMLGYSSPQHLSTQFRKITGMTPSQFKKNGRQLRKYINDVG